LSNNELMTLEKRPVAYTRPCVGLVQAEVLGIGRVDGRGGSRTSSTVEILAWAARRDQGEVKLSWRWGT
jgi:hypothetical protein